MERIVKSTLILFLIIFNIVVIDLVARGETTRDRNTLGTRGKTDDDKATGPLRVHTSNPRYFTDRSGKAIYLTGSHYWYNFQDGENRTKMIPFDYDAYLDFVKNHNHNFIRMWVWEQAAWAPWTKEKVLFNPLPYDRTGPGKALYGGLKFDLTKFNQAYFDRLRSKVIAARDRRIYVSIMLFQGFSIETKGKNKGNPWKGHPFNLANNVNGINGDPNGDGEGKEVHTLSIPEITRLQEAYVRNVVDMLNDLNNVLYEISNESHDQSTDWQYHMINYIHNYEATRPKQHPVLMTVQWPGGDNTVLFNSPAEAISPNPGGGYKDNPPAANGSKVIISDTDHLWGIGGNHSWVWKSFLRGLNPIFMDPYTAKEHQNHPSKPEWEQIRKSMGNTLTYAKKINLISMVPQGDLTSTGYCLTNQGKEYLIYLPPRDNRVSRSFSRLIRVNETVTVDLAAASGTLNVEWFNPKTGETKDGGTTTGGAKQSFMAPFTGDAVLYIYMP